MSTTPPRRSRPKPPSGGSSFPFVPIIGVIVIGFIIGAGLSVMGHHGSGDTVALATSSPLADETESAAPTAVPTPIPGVAKKAKLVATPSAVETASPKPSPSERASQRPSSSPVARASAASAPPASATPTAHAVTATPARVAALATATHHVATPPATLAPTEAPTLAASAVPVATMTPAAVLDAQGAFSTLAGNVVRQYLLSIARGDTDSAYAALGDAPGSHPDSVPEIGTVDSTMHIAKIMARGSDSSATVDVDLTTSAGPYYGQYTVHKSATGAAIIVSHTFGKP